MIDAETFAALADPTRLDIVTTLARGPATVTQLAEPHDMSLRAVLKHIQILERSAIVTTTKRGRTRSCELRPETLASTARWLTAVEQRWLRRLDRIEQLIEKERG